MSESTPQSNEGPAVPVVPVFPVLEGFSTRPAVPPPGTAFALGWLMAELFDPRRRVSQTVRRPLFDSDVQLPQVPDLAPDPKLLFLAADLAEIVKWYKKLAAPAAAVTRETDKLKAAVDSLAVSVGNAAAAVDAAGDAIANAAAELTGGAAETAVGAAVGETAVGETAAGAGFSAAALATAVMELNQAILDDFADTPERLSAYQLGLALSDLTWLPYIPAAGQPESAGGKPSALTGLFSRPQLAATKTLLNGAGTQLPSSAAAIVSQSLDSWADWLDVNAANFTVQGRDAWSAKADVVLSALRVQGSVWYSVLIADPDVSVSPSMGAWVEAASSITRATSKISVVILRRFWPLVLIALAALGGLLALVIVNLSGASQVWASLVTVVAVVGASGVGLGNGVSGAFDGLGYEVWAAAKLDATAWNVTWLPGLATTAGQRSRLNRMGVASPQVRKNLDPR